MAGAKDGRFYIRVDVGFWDHPKAVAAGRDGRDLYLAALAWTRAQLQDGDVPAAMLPPLAFRVGMPIDDGQAAADRLVEVGLWERTADGWYVHDYAEHQMTAAEIAEQREKWRAKKARQRVPTEMSPGDTPGNPPNVPGSETETETETEKTTPPTPPSRYSELLHKVAWMTARATPNVKSVNGLQRTIVAQAIDTGLADELERLMAKHPDRDIEWLADEHLGRKHPPMVCSTCNRIGVHARTCPLKVRA